MEKTDLNKQSLLVLIVFFCHIQKGTGFTSSPTASINCASSVANINFSLHLDPGETIVGKRIWFFGATKVAESNGTTLTSFGSYLSRVNAYGTYGISLSNVTLADAGSYTYTITLSPSGNPAIAAATLTVQVPPLAPPSGCSLSVSQSGNTVTCTVNTGSGNCGTPALIPNWVNSTPPSNQFECTVGETHQCCATSDALACYSRTSNDFCTLYTCIPTTPPPPGTTTTTTTTVTSSSTSMSSTTSSVLIDDTSTKPTTNGSASTTISTSSNITIGNISVTPATNGSASATNNTSTSTKPTLSESTTINNTSTKPAISGSATINNTASNKSISSDSDIKVIVPAVVVPSGLLIIGGIILVVCYVRRRTGKNVRESPVGMAVQDKGNNIDEWKQSQGRGKPTDNLDAVYTTPDGFVIFPDPAAISSARSYKKHHDGTDQYNRPYAGPYYHQAEYFPSTYTSARAYTHKDKKHHGVSDQYSSPYTGTYGYQAGYIPNTYKSARTYPHKGRNHDYEGPIIHQQASHLMATGILAYDQTTYYPQTGHYGQNSQDVYYSGGGQYSYGQRSRSHYDHSGRKQQREYYKQYEMADYGGIRAGYRHTKQDTAFYY